MVAAFDETFDDEAEVKTYIMCQRVDPKHCFVCKQCITKHFLCWHPFSLHLTSVWLLLAVLALMPRAGIIKTNHAIHTNSEIRAEPYRKSYGFLKFINSIIYCETHIITTADFINELTLRVDASRPQLVLNKFGRDVSTRRANSFVKSVVSILRVSLYMMEFMKFRNLFFPIGLRSDFRVRVNSIDLLNDASAWHQSKQSKQKQTCIKCKEMGATQKRGL